MILYSEQCDIDASLLDAEMTVALNMFKKSKEEDTNKTLNLQDFLGLLSDSPKAFRNLIRCMQIALTVPVTSASCERSFSAMKFIKNYLRNKMSDERLSNLTLLYVHKLRKLDPYKIAKIFSRQSVRGIPFPV